MDPMLPAGSLILNFVVFFLFAFASIFLVLVLLFVFVSATVEFVKRKKVEEKDTEIRENAYEDALKILDEARDKSVKIFGDSQLRAQKILGEASNLSEQSRKELVDKLESLYSKQEEIYKQLSSDFVKSYKVALEQEKTENIRTLAETTELIKDEVLSDIDEFKDSIRKSTFESQQKVEEKLQASYEQVEKEIQQYKKDKISSLNQKIFHILADISEKTIGRAVDLTEHEKFIIDALKDEVKKLGIRNDPPNNDKN